MRRTKEEADKTRKELLEAASRVFARKGYGATKLEEIAIEAGLTRGAISWHFKNKQTIFRSLIEESAIEALTSIDGLLRNDIGDPIKRLEIVVAHLVQNRHRKKYHVAILSKLKQERPVEFADLVEEVETVQGLILQSFKKTIDEIIPGNQSNASFSSELFAKSLYTFFWGFFYNHDEFYADYSDEMLISLGVQSIARVLSLQDQSLGKNQPS